ncbi:4a-hydroxytetrahydrobiopterin dehydratase [Thermoleptolyngbya sp. C42_A2020_037]|uniref:4a-hydroxytetrahydrobiopterin dehydratase n=1 Tax=Thermoleptolyngbya sp. C42_A2020_037 TaxID=2747799 RepID=UPI0019F0AA68|nr:4a-hydroxytetrahydrobiopterin dehydratase [Thermoleptolyngbya sp. C42_A2020_037]MBF2087042.1 4a-hydroxytetrahydrobiopterin dehydratase [Thermoleptolyngbya sp. C42_A2020_037]
MSQPLTDAEIQAQMAQVPGWILEGDRLQRTYRFKDFLEAIAFVNKLVEPAEAAGHHPDIAISYNRVTVTLTTHDAGGLTQQDFDLAATVSKL